ncbi:MAG: HlyD family type I secretion periplasmic adaptor subunit [Rhodocyclaceae bacterium]|nr:HlyD family type I secretion periplasmic adaptor subunit [Rhodocyclaceae bacterium]
MSGRGEAWTDLLRRYREAFAFHWRQRNAFPDGMFSVQEAEFLPAALSLQEKPVSPAGRLVAKLLMALVATLLVWSVLGRMDIIVNASGKVIPSGRTKTLASVDVASVRAVHVVEGQAVKAGQVLIELDTTAQDAERDKALGDATMARLQAERSSALIAAVESLRPPRLPSIAGLTESQWRAAQSHLEGQYRDFRAKLARIEGDIRRLEEALPLATQRARDFEALAQDHDVSTHAWLEKEQARIELAGQLTDARNQRTALIAETRKVAHELLTEGHKVAEAARQDARRADEHGKLLRLTAPVDGTVQQLNVHTVGGVVPAAQPLMLVVPKENVVEVEAFLENKDIGFVREGQEAAVKVDAFQYTKYGTVPGRVTHVSRDAIQDEKKGLIYSVKVALDRATLPVDGKDMPLSAGMSVAVEIKTGERRVIEYVLSPLLQHQRESLHER